MIPHEDKDDDYDDGDADHDDDDDHDNDDDDDDDDDDDGDDEDDSDWLRQCIVAAVAWKALFAGALSKHRGKRKDPEVIGLVGNFAGKADKFIAI